MSKRDVTVLCTLAAHLQRACVSWQSEDFDPDYTPAQCAADAMTLQRMAQNIRARAKNMHRIRWGTYLMNMCEKAERVLKPYGLVGVLSPTGIVIEGLPGNTGGGEEDGYGI